LRDEGACMSRANVPVCVLRDVMGMCQGWAVCYCPIQIDWVFR